MASGRINLQSNDGKVAGVVFEDGASSNVTVTIPKEGGTLATQTGLDTAMSTINASVPAAYHIYNGQLALANTVTTAGFSTTLYTGNGASQSITTGVDMDTQWGNDASEKFGGLIWLKSRSTADYHLLHDTVRGVGMYLATNTTSVPASGSTQITSIVNNGFNVGDAFPSGMQMVSWNFQTTHRVSGTTNHGKAYTCHYNPFTGFTIVKYEGSGLAGHEIPHHLGRKLGLYTIKNLSQTSDWWVKYKNESYLYLSNTSAEAGDNGPYSGIGDEFSIKTYLVNNLYNDTSKQYIMYGWANSYKDEANKLIGNYEVGVYQGTGAAGNKVTTRGKPAWIMIKRLDSTGEWWIVDNMRGTRPLENVLRANLSNVEINYGVVIRLEDGFWLADDVNLLSNYNASGGQYLYMVVYDNDSGSGKSKYPRATDTSTLNLNAHVPFANGIDTTGSKVSIAYKNETITLSNALTQGKNYIALLNDGSYVAKTIKPSYGLINPASGDFFNLDTQKWYSNLNVEITPRNYLDCIVYADQNGQPEYVEQIEKVQYFDAVKANDFRGKNACTAWVNFDGTTTPPTIRDSYNVSSVVRTATGVYDVYFVTPMDNANYVCTGMARDNEDDFPGLGVFRKLSDTKTTSVFRINIYYTTSAYNSNEVNIQIFGGRN